MYSLMFYKRTILKVFRDYEEYKATDREHPTEFEGYNDYNSVSVPYQHKLLPVQNRASGDAV